MIFAEEVLGEGTGLCSLDLSEFSGPSTFLIDILVWCPKPSPCSSHSMEKQGLLEQEE